MALVFLLLPLRFSVLTFAILIMIHLCMRLFVFILFTTLCASYICTSVSFLRLGKFSVLMSSNKFSTPFCLSFLLLGPIEILMCLMCFQGSLKLFPFFSVCFFLLFWFPLFYLPNHLCVLLYHLVSCLFLLACFSSVQLLYSALTDSFLRFLDPC